MENFTNNIPIQEALADAERVMLSAKTDQELQEQFDILSKYVGKLEGSDKNFATQLREVRAKLTREIYLIRSGETEKGENSPEKDKKPIDGIYHF